MRLSCRKTVPFCLLWSLGHCQMISQLFWRSCHRETSLETHTNTHIRKDCVVGIQYYVNILKEHKVLNTLKLHFKYMDFAALDRTFSAYKCYSSTKLYLMAIFTRKVTTGEVYHLAFEKHKMSKYIRFLIFWQYINCFRKKRVIKCFL